MGCERLLWYYGKIYGGHFLFKQIAYRHQCCKILSSILIKGRSNIKRQWTRYYEDVFFLQLRVTMSL